MRALNHPTIDSVDLATVLNALADPIRLRVIGQLAEAGGVVCGGFDVPVSMSTLSHHLKVLREAGLVRVTPEGSHRRHELRADEIEGRYPGVLSSIITATRDPA
ncbi:DNA-binding transcriptional ArsR family regulator [Nocardia transvalensis]|uniref:DNA-binding transcriptional ArsR family regulator n=1 Tax=Nocardia transvalensis TaxID=37333 RepID=A0A7W9PMB9_9NOCA|nr:metalloregulator ArsR/SmtB family transcription factor [Nocardia transvalensis]MBB5918595.1 DNA-binding transcriptional ArsR family regulator [Nocardia transvalensis]